MDGDHKLPNPVQTLFDFAPSAIILLLALNAERSETQHTFTDETDLENQANLRFLILVMAQHNDTIQKVPSVPSGIVGL